jgi:hypothetical protein
MNPPGSTYGVSPRVTEGDSPGPTGQRRWPRWLRRGPLEMAACIVIALGIFMMLQPFALVLYTWSFGVTLAGVAMFTIVSKFPS